MELFHFGNESVLLGKLKQHIVEQFLFDSLQKRLFFLGTIFLLFYLSQSQMISILEFQSPIRPLLVSVSECVQSPVIYVINTIFIIDKIWYLFVDGDWEKLFSLNVFVFEQLLLFSMFVFQFLCSYFLIILFKYLLAFMINLSWLFTNLFLWNTVKLIKQLNLIDCL